MVSMAENNKKIVIALLLAGIILASGCVEKIAQLKDLAGGGKCGEIEKELKSQGRECKCYSTDFVPKKFKNKTGVEGKCFCTCKAVKKDNVTKENVVVLEGEKGYIISHISSKSPEGQQ